jgi:hypothetical protein
MFFMIALDYYQKYYSGNHSLKIPHLEEYILLKKEKYKPKVVELSLEDG